MHPCDQPPPPCPPPAAPAPAPAPEPAVPSEYHNNPFGPDGATGTNDVGADTQAPGTIIDDSGLGGVPAPGDLGLGSIDASIVGDVLLPVAAAIGVATCLIGLRQLSELVKSIMKTIEKVKENKADFLYLANESSDLMTALASQYQKAKDEELKKDIIAAAKVLGSLEIFCKEVAEQSRLDRLMHRKENKRKIALYKAKFRSARQVLMFKSVLDVRRVVHDDLHPDLKDLQQSVKKLKKRVVKSLQEGEASRQGSPMPTPSPAHSQQNLQQRPDAYDDDDDELPEYLDYPPDSQPYSDGYEQQGQYEEYGFYEEGPEQQYQQQQQQQFYQHRPHSWAGGDYGSQWGPTSDPQYYDDDWSQYSPDPSGMGYNYNAYSHSSSDIPSYSSHYEDTMYHVNANFLTAPGLGQHVQNMTQVSWGNAHPQKRKKGKGGSKTIINNFGSGGNTTVTNVNNSHNVNYHY